MIEYIEALMRFVSSFKVWAIIAPDEAGVHLRAGKIKRILQEGIHFQWPIFDYVEKVITSEQAVDLPNQTLTTKDLKTVNISGVIVYEVTEPSKALYNLSDYDKSLPTVAMHIIGEEVPNFNFSPDLPEVKEKVVSELEKRASGWGISIINFGFSDTAITQPIRLYQ